MVRVTTLWLLVHLFVLIANTDAQVTGFRVPRVYGDTGRPLPPARALQVYQRRYGRPWHGLGGRFIRTSPTTRGFGRLSPGYAVQRHYVYHLPAYITPVYFSGWGPGYGPTWAPSWGVPWGGYLASGTVLNVAPAGPIFSADAFDAVGDRLLDELPARPHDAGELQGKASPAPAPVFRRVPQVSTPADRRRARRLIADGDVDLQRQRPTAARQHYHQAILAAPDFALSRFRTAMAEVLLGRNNQAVTLLKQGLALDRNWPRTGESLDELLGPGNVLLKKLIIEKVSGWVKLKLRTPDRLFLLGVLLHFDDDKKHSRLLLRTAWQLGDRGQHLAAFLDPAAR